MRLFAVSLIGVCALGSVPVLAAPAKFVSKEGKWNLDVADTHYPAGVVITGNDLDVAKDDGKTLKFSETVTMNGTASHIRSAAMRFVEIFDKAE